MLIPAIDDGLCLGAVGDLPLGLDANVEPACPGPDGGSTSRDGPQSKPARGCQASGSTFFCVT
jgi:hypothetical protein